MGWGRSSGSRKGKRGGSSSGGSGADKPKQPQRGLGVAQLEKIRLQSEMAEYFHPLGGQPPSLIHRTASLNLVSEDTSCKAEANICVYAYFVCMDLLAIFVRLGVSDSLRLWNGSIEQEDTRASTSSLSSSPSSPFHATAVSSAFPVHPNFGMAYGERGDGRYGEFQTPIVRSPSSSTIYGPPHYAHPGVTLPLFAPEESTRLRGHHDRSRSADSTSMNSDDPEDVDLELKL
ncbi:hypothetical protein ACQJBY_023166 [Aegilops geniculata]